jgi:arsenate reductase (glutaredoxin)
MKNVEIWHNPRCSKSRQALELLKKKGIEPKIVLYLETPPTAARLAQVLELLGMAPRELMRKAEPPYRELDLGNPDRSSRELVSAMTEHPILIERPVVIAGDRAVVARPPERALELVGG